MKYFAEIVYKSGRYDTVDNLVSITSKGKLNAAAVKITNFEEFRLMKDHELTFVGDTIVSCFSNEVEFARISKI